MSNAAHDSPESNGQEFLRQFVELSNKLGRDSPESNDDECLQQIYDLNNKFGGLLALRNQLTNEFDIKKEGVVLRGGVRRGNLAPYERNQLSAWNNYNPLVLKDVQSGELQAIKNDHWGCFAGRLDCNIQFNIENLIVLNKSFYNDLMLNIAESLDEKDPIWLSASIKDLYSEIGTELRDDLFNGRGVFKKCSVFIVDKYNRSLNGEFGLEQKKLPGITVFPGLIANETILEIEKFPYYNRLKKIPGETIKNAFEKLIMDCIGCHELPEIYQKYFRDEITITELDSLQYPAIQTKVAEKPDTIFDEDNYTPPISATQLTSSLGLVKSTASDKKSPLCRFFKSQSEKQGSTKTPRLNYADLFPIAKECMRRSTEGKELSSIVELREIIEGRDM